MNKNGNRCATLEFDGKKIVLPLVEGTEGEKAIDISGLRKNTGLVALDPGFVNTASCYSNITYINGEEGVLRYRGYPIEELVNHSVFIDTAYLLVNGELPDATEHREFSRLLNECSLIHEDMRHFFDSFPRGSHPMHILSTMINAMAAFYPDVDLKSLDEDINQSCARVISIVRTLAAFAYKR